MLRRRSAGEHAIDTPTLIDAMVSEWQLNHIERLQLMQEAESFEQQQTARMDGDV